MEYKYCPQCGDEFQNWVEACPDCEVPLGHERLDPKAQPAGDLPPARELEAVFVGEPWQVREPVDSLAEAGIECRVDAFPPGDFSDDGAGIGSFGSGTRVAVYVRREDLARIASLDADWVRSTLATDSELDACPGCSAPLAVDATACGECGLEFPEVAMCERCGSSMELSATVCGVCGTLVSAEGS